MTDILIPDPESFQTKLAMLIEGGAEHLHVIADFDRTLTKAFIDGKPMTSLPSILEEEGHLGAQFNEASKKLFNTYHPIEMDPLVPLEEKKAAMVERWTGVFSLMLENGLTRDMIRQTMQSEMITFRDGYAAFFDILKEHAIPLLILSATGLGYESIYFCLEKFDKLSDNIDIISNAFDRDENGKAIAVREPIIHSFNKGEAVVHDLPIFKEIKKRKNIILIGDTLGDAHMADGFPYKHILKIGFLNHDTPENRERFQETFDLIILGDGPLDEVNALIKKIVG